jgi:hypothetical protein
VDEEIAEVVMIAMTVGAHKIRLMAEKGGVMILKEEAAASKEEAVCSS